MKRQEQARSDEAAIPEWMYRWLGYGDIRSPLWFVGIEPGGRLEGYSRDEPPARHSLGSEYFHVVETRPEGGGTRVWSRCKDIAAKAGFGSDYFLSNMSPIPSRDAVQANGASPDRLNDYHELLYLAYRTFEPRAVVFHGKGERGRRGFYSHGLNATFKLGNSPQQIKVDARGHTIHKFSPERILLCGNFSRGVSAGMLEAVSGTLQEWQRP